MDRSLTLIYWFVFLGFRPNGQKLLNGFSIGIASALAKYVKHIWIPPERITNYDMYLHMFNHIYLISFCRFCRASRFREGILGAGTACTRQSSLERAFCCCAVSFLCYLSRWNLKFTIFKWCVWNYMTLLCHNIIHPKILVKGSLPLSPPPNQRSEHYWENND